MVFDHFIVDVHGSFSAFQKWYREPGTDLSEQA
jgi:fructose-1,6-bisphosphatase